MVVKQASKSDKEKVLDFCKNTFSWGDYIAEIWDYWISEGNLLVVEKNKQPIAICHASIYDDNLWIEGIRVHPKFRRLGHAKSLITECEKIAQKKNCTTVQMLIETNNSNSITLASSLGYSIKDTWNFYSLDSSSSSIGQKVEYSLSDLQIKSLLSENFLFVDSWRWYKLTKKALLKLLEEKKILFSIQNNKLNGIATFCESKHFEKTVLVTVLFGNNLGLSNIFSEILLISKQRKYKRIQILTHLKSLPMFQGLEQKLSFNLVEKKL